MRLNDLRPANGSKQSPKRLGRGMGSGLGKTSGRGHKGQRARAGGFHKLGFEGGQTPIQRRLPKFGFTSHKAMVTTEVRLCDLEKISGDIVTLETLLQANLISHAIKYVKIIAKGEIKRSFQVKGLGATKGARSAIEASGGTIEI